MFMLGHAAVILLSLVVVVTVMWMIYWLWRRHQEKLGVAAERWSERGRMGEAEFLAGCGIACDGLEKNVALAARRVIGEILMVPAETICPDDRWKDFGCLMDSVDWLDFLFRIEKGAWVKVHARNWEGERVKDFVRAVSLSAEELPPVTRNGLRKEDFVGR
jgi:hypothetical protein